MHDWLRRTEHHQRHNRLVKFQCRHYESIFHSVDEGSARVAAFRWKLVASCGGCLNNFTLGISSDEARLIGAAKYMLYSVVVRKATLNESEFTYHLSVINRISTRFCGFNNLVRRHPRKKSGDEEGYLTPLHCLLTGFAGVTWSNCMLSAAAAT